MKRLQLLIDGRVQGVWYRAAMAKVAVRYGVTGWVRNCADQRVEALVEGDEEKVRSLVDWTKKGPILARVKNVTVEELPGREAEFGDFEVRP